MIDKDCSVIDYLPVVEGKVRVEAGSLTFVGGGSSQHRLVIQSIDIHPAGDSPVVIALRALPRSLQVEAIGYYRRSTVTESPLRSNRRYEEGRLVNELTRSSCVTAVCQYKHTLGLACSSVVVNTWEMEWRISRASPTSLQDFPLGWILPTQFRALFSREQ